MNGDRGLDGCGVGIPRSAIHLFRCRLRRRVRAEDEYGLLIGIDLVRNLKTKALMSRKVTEVIFKEALKRGLLLMGYFPRVRINPPLVITEAQAEAGAEILDEVFAYVRDHVDWRHA